MASCVFFFNTAADYTTTVKREGGDEKREVCNIVVQKVVCKTGAEVMTQLLKLLHN